MFNKLISYFNKYELCRPKHSTIHPIIHLLNNNANNNINKKATLSIFCDLSKAFDVFDRKILLTKLQYYTRKGSWLVIKLSFWKNSIKLSIFDGTFSKPAAVCYGVPQGSILGPLLCLIYVNDIDIATSGQILIICWWYISIPLKFQPRNCISWCKYWSEQIYYTI